MVRVLGLRASSNQNQRRTDSCGLSWKKTTKDMDSKTGAGVALDKLLHTERVRLSGIEHVDLEIVELDELSIAKETHLAGLLIAKRGETAPQ